MSKEEKDDGASISVGPDHVKAHVSEGVLTRLGDAAAWLFPDRDARVKITAALAHRVSQKIAAGQQLDQQEMYFVSRVFGKEARALSNREAVADAVQKVLPEVESQMRMLPPAGRKSANDTFVARAEEMASEPSEDEVREIFARILAGEVTRPGTISLRTLEAVRMFDRELAVTFDTARRLALDNAFIILDVPAARGLTDGRLTELQDAGLVDPSSTGVMLTVGPEGIDWIWAYQDREMRVRASKRNGATSTRISARRLTRVGQEIASVLPVAPDEGYFFDCCALVQRILGDGGSVSWKYKSASDWRECGSDHG